MKRIVAQDSQDIIDQDIKEMEESEIPDIDIEMAIQRKYPHDESKIIPHGKEAQTDTESSVGKPTLIDIAFDTYTTQAMAKIGVGNHVLGWRWELSQSSNPEWMIDGRASSGTEVNKLMKNNRAAYTLTLGMINILKDYPGFNDALKANLGEPQVTQWSPSVVQAQKFAWLSDSAFKTFYNK